MTLNFLMVKNGFMWIRLLPVAFLIAAAIKKATGSNRIHIKPFFTIKKLSVIKSFLNSPNFSMVHPFDNIKRRFFLFQYAQLFSHFGKGSNRFIQVLLFVAGT